MQADDGVRLFPPQRLSPCEKGLMKMEQENTVLLPVLYRLFSNMQDENGNRDIKNKIKIKIGLAIFSQEQSRISRLREAVFCPSNQDYPVYQKRFLAQL
jgi:hypothetical protein